MDAEIKYLCRLHYQAKFARLFWLFCRGSFGMYNTFYGSAQTFAFDYFVMQSENMFATVLSAMVLFGGSELYS